MSSFRLINFNTFVDERGSMVVIEQGTNSPFNIKRTYYIFDVKNNIERGFHAHKNLKEIAIALNGSCTFVMDNGLKRTEIQLNNPNQGLLMNGLIWREMKNFSHDCLLLVLASELYDESDYIRDYDEFKVAKGL